MTAALQAFHFERAAWLWLLAPAVILWILERRSDDPADRWRGVIDPALLNHLLIDQRPTVRLSPNSLLFAAWCLGAIGAAGPVWQREPSPFADAKPPVVVLLKVTPSMLTADLAPTRLDRARQKLSDLLKAREGAATGLIAYAGSTHLALPPTPDGRVVLDLAGGLSPGIMPREGDALSTALTQADRLLSGDERGGSILIMADTVAGEQLARLSELKLLHPVTVFSLLPPDMDLGALADAARSLGATLVPTTVDGTDIRTLATRLDRAGEAGDVAGEGQHWKAAGYWLVPFLALIVLAWFRRGWVLT